jgi:hypothetical protein
VPWDVNDFDESIKRLIHLDHTYQDFIRSATLNAKILIKELFKDNHRIAYAQIVLLCYVLDSHFTHFYVNLIIQCE